MDRFLSIVIIGYFFGGELLFLDEDFCITFAYLDELALLLVPIATLIKALKALLASDIISSFSPLGLAETFELSGISS